MEMWSFKRSKILQKCLLSQGLVYSVVFTAGRPDSKRRAGIGRLEQQRGVSEAMMEDGLEQRRAFWEQGRQFELYIF